MHKLAEILKDSREAPCLLSTVMLRVFLFRDHTNLFMSTTKAASADLKENISKRIKTGGSSAIGNPKPSDSKKRRKVEPEPEEEDAPGSPSAPGPAESASESEDAGEAKEDEDDDDDGDVFSGHFAPKRNKEDTGMNDRLAKLPSKFKSTIDSFEAALLDHIPKDLSQ